MNYQRKMLLQSSHFNGAEQYVLLATARDAAAPMQARLDAALSCLRDSHGHNFEVEVDVTVARLDGQRFVVEDEKLSELIARWNNTNLSVHPDFAGGRATTEEMAVALARKVGVELLAHASGPVVRVTVRETPDIAASAEWTRDT